MNDFYSRLIEREGLDKLVKESSKQNNLEQSVDIVPYQKKGITKIDIEQSYLAIKEIGRKSFTGGKEIVKFTGKSIINPFIITTALRKISDPELELYYVAESLFVGMFGTAISTLAGIKESSPICFLFHK